jgi:hypothetical protein
MLLDSTKARVVFIALARRIETRVLGFPICQHAWSPRHRLCYPIDAVSLLDWSQLLILTGFENASCRAAQEKADSLSARQLGKHWLAVLIFARQQRPTLDRRR